MHYDNVLAVHACLSYSEADYAANVEQPYALAAEESEEAYDVYEDIVQYKPSKVIVFSTSGRLILAIN